MSQPKKNLEDIVGERLERVFEGQDKYRRVLWWDEGGNLEDLLKDICEKNGWGFVSAGKFLLDLRLKSNSDPSSPELWHIPGSKQDKGYEINWFTEIAEQGAELERDIIDLCVEMYDDLNRWDFEGLINKSSPRVVSELIDKLTKTHIPDSKQIRIDLLVRGEAQNVFEFLLNPTAEEIVDKKRLEQLLDLIRDEGYRVDSKISFEDLVLDVRKNAVAGYLMQNDVPEKFFVDRMVRNHKNTKLIRALRNTLKKQPLSQGSNIYLRECYFSEIPEQVTENKTLFNLVIDQSVDISLWKKVKDHWEDDTGLSKEFSELVKGRLQEFKNIFNEPTSLQNFKAWSNLSYLNQFIEYLQTWREKTSSENVFQRYREDSGDWKLDKIARKLMQLRPEQNLKTAHPAYEFLKEKTKLILEENYTNFLKETGSFAKSALKNGYWERKTNPTYDWWNNHKSELSQDNLSMIFYIDALRMDLMKELQSKLMRDFGLEATPEFRLAPLPSVTEVGMGALVSPPEEFSVSCQNGEFRTYKGSTRVDQKKQRVKQLEEEGFVNTEDIKPKEISVSEEGTESRMAYHYLKLDKMGHDEVEGFGRLIDETLENLADKIREVITAGGMEQVFVITDHGFLLFPEFEKEPTPLSVNPGDAEIIKPNFLAGDSLSEDIKGVSVDQRSPGFSYLNTKLKILFDPFKQYKKRGSGFERFSHGGGLPQECMLMFLKVEN